MISKNFEGAQLLKIGNTHSESCGTPPILNASNNYIGYFENQYGEQWVFIGDIEKESAEIYGGDIDWAGLKIDLKKPVPDTILNQPEAHWIISCLMGMTAKSYDQIGKVWDDYLDKLAKEII